LFIFSFKPFLSISFFFLYVLTGWRIDERGKESHFCVIIISSMPHTHRSFSSVYWCFFLTSTIELIHQGIYMHACDSGSRYYTIALVDCFTRSVCGCVYGMKSNHSARHYFLFFCFCSEKEKKIVVQNKRETRVSLPSLFQLMQ
jgi:hypothetical protein